MKQYTLTDFEGEFPNDDACLEWLKNYLYPDGILCKVCGRITKHHRVVSRRSYSCDICGHHVHPTAGTIYEKSTTPLRMWFHATFLLSSTRCGISAKQLQRELGVTYKTAWRMFHQIRCLLSEEGKLLTGSVEVDETYIGGKHRGGKRGRGDPRKTAVFGMTQRGGGIVAQPVSNVATKTILPLIEAHVDKSALVYTDEFFSYNTLTKNGFDHRRVNHAKGQYVFGDAHTNTIEGFWSQLKRSINGTYHHVSPKWLPLYVSEYAFRYSHRKDENPMFKTLLARVG